MTDLTQSKLQQLSSLPEGNLLVIDGDAIPYMFGWHAREHRDERDVQRKIDQWIRELFTLASASAYLGVLSSGKKCFRYEVYKYRPYKGTRTEKEEWLTFWEPVIRQYLIERYGFTTAPECLETDDVVATMGKHLPKALSAIGSDKHSYICSPDKDLKQIAGLHIDYRKSEMGGGIKWDTVSEQQARYNWCMQMLTGDNTDNIAGVPGLGDKKAAALLAEDPDGYMWETKVKLAYQKYFGPHYGEIIYTETAAVITLLHPDHPLWNHYAFPVEQYIQNFRSVYDPSIRSETQREEFMHLVSSSVT